jgi:hypothetical protein
MGPAAPEIKIPPLFIDEKEQDSEKSLQRELQFFKVE